MLILFSLIVMRMSGMILVNPFFGSSNIPSRVKGALVMTFSLMLYVWQGGVLTHEPGTLLEYGAMLLGEVAMGCVLGFSMELAVLVVRYSSAVIDFSMGFNMAQVYDPETRGQVTVTSGLQFALFMLLFLAGNAHLRLVSIFFGSAARVPFGEVSLGPAVYTTVLSMFREAIVMGFQLALPVIAMELVTEAAVGVMMRMIPQINVFAVNFQIKITVGLLMLLFLFSPMADKLKTVIDWLFANLDYLVMQMR